MLAFDIETTGLHPETSVVTVVCTEDFHTGIRKAYEFGRARDDNHATRETLRKELIDAFDSAPSLCAFNGIRFDIPFLHKALQIPPKTSAGWLLKTTDILEACRLGLYGPTHTFALNLLCQHNQIKVKSGNGLQAVKFAQEGRWADLLSYCTDDVRILCDLYRRRLLNNPRSYDVINLRKIAPSGIYAPDSVEESDAADQKERLRFYENYMLDSWDNRHVFERLESEIRDLKQKLAIYHEICVCL